MNRSLRLLLLVGLLAPAPALAEQATGLWWADGGGAQVDLQPCEPNGDTLCGRLVWLSRPLDPSGCPLRDANNPDAALRNRELLGIRMVEGLRPHPTRTGVWEGGSVYDPGSGSTSRAEARLDGPGRLLLRGYLGLPILGRTETWTRVGESNACEAPA